MFSGKCGHDYSVFFSKYFLAIPAANRMIRLKITRRVDTAAMVGLISVLIPSHNFFGRVDRVGLLMKSAIINLSYCA